MGGVVYSSAGDATLGMFGLPLAITAGGQIPPGNYWGGAWSAMVNGTADSVSWFGGVLRRVQSGYLYSYAFWMVIGLAVLLGWYLTHP